MDKSEMTRKFECDNGRTYLAHPKACLFCDNCTNIVFDYTNGPYMAMCDIGLPEDIGMTGKCKGFKEDGEQE